jgi:glutathione peroxidase
MSLPKSLASVFAAVSLASAPAPATAATPAAPARTVHDFRARLNDGTETALSRWRGKVVLIVNTASRCGFTPQYEGLEAIAERYRARGFEVLAFPANDFLGQEPGTDEQIATFCATRYHTSFPLFAKVSVKGKRIHPLYAYLTRESAFPGDIGWNFTKFLVGPDGRVAARFDSRVKPESDEVTAAIERLLPAK